MLVLHPIRHRGNMYVKLLVWLFNLTTNSRLTHLVQVIGYICRAASHDNFYGIPLYAMQTLFILLAPPLYAASIYMVLGRTVTYLQAENLSMVPIKWMTKIFVTGDVFSFLLQCAGKYITCHQIRQQTSYGLRTMKANHISHFRRRSHVHRRQYA